MKVLLYGAGGHAKVVIECLMANSITPALFFDDNMKKKEWEKIEVKRYNSDIMQNTSMIISIGNNNSRMKIAEQVKHAYINSIHPSAQLSKNSEIGTGCQVIHSAIIQAGTSIGNHVILNTASTIDHDCHVSNFAHIGPGSTICGGVNIGEGTFVGAGSVVLPNVKIGNWVNIGAGSVVNTNVPDNAIVAGNPLRVIK